MRTGRTGREPEALGVARAAVAGVVPATDKFGPVRGRAVCGMMARRSAKSSQQRDIGTTNAQVAQRSTTARKCSGIGASTSTSAGSY
jgi:hypothetical protein